VNVLANRLRWSRGDEVLVLANGFPATVFRWFIAERRARICQLQLDPPKLTAERLSAELAQRRRAAARGTDHLRLKMALRPIRNRLLRDPSQPVGLCVSSSHAVDLRCAERIRAEDFAAGRRAFAVLTLQLRGIDFDA
jgi:hypothetical protein